MAYCWFILRHLIHRCKRQVDSPKEAQAAEETGSKFEGGSPGQDEASHADVEQKQKPTYTTSGPSFGQTKPPTDMGDMRSQTTVSGDKLAVLYVRSVLINRLRVGGYGEWSDWSCVG